MFRRRRHTDPLGKGSRDIGGLLSGRSFEMAIRNGEVPPPPWTFCNRFLSGVPSQWANRTLNSSTRPTTTCLA